MDSLTVPGSLEGWTPGCVVRPGDTLRVEATGAIRYGSSPPVYALPEGIYPSPENQTDTHAFEPDRCSPFTGDNGQFLVGNTVKACLNLVVTREATPRPSVAGGLDGLRPERDTTYTYEDLAAAAGVTDGHAVRTWFSFNDHLGGFADNEGAFSVTLTRTTPTPGATPNLESLKALVRPQYGAESASAPGTAVDAERQFVILERFLPKVKATQSEHGVGGSMRNLSIIPEEEWIEFEAPFLPDYNEQPELLASALCLPASFEGAQPGAYRHFFRPESARINSLKSFTVQYGNPDTRVFQCTRAMFNRWGLKTSRGAGAGNVKGESAGYARRQEAASGNAFTPGRNAIQTVVVTAAGGTFTLADVNGQTTGPLDFDETPANVQAALRTLFSSTGLTVAGGAGSYTVTFAGDVGARNWPDLVADGAALTGITPSIAVETTQRGGVQKHDFVPLLPNQVSVYYAADRADLFTGDAQRLRNFECEILVDGRHQPFFVQNSSLPSYAGHAERDTEDGLRESIRLKCAVDAQGIAYLDDWRNAAKKYVGVQAVSNQLIPGTTLPYILQFQACVGIRAVGDYGDTDGIWTMEYTLEPLDDPTWGGFAYEVMVQNAVASYEATA